MKIFTLCRFVLYRPAKKYFAMRLTVYLLFLSIMQVAASAYSQDDKVTIDAQNKPVKEIFNEIQEQSSYRFFYSDDLIDLNRKINIASKNESIESVLADISSQSGINYQVLEDNLIVISPSENYQGNTVTGRITSMMDGEGIPGVN
ncbi:MAG: STN domain-containing protein, partial [Cyclobacteriaceae bacterium]|nr:STN domain-containing protein [Cyclobacteriaceae bacterium]